MSSPIALSLLIPIYNVDVTDLVETLHSQAMQLNISFEIRCYDDGSEENILKANARLTALPFVVYQVLPVNIGRARIRNLLARDALYPYLLLMDCDHKVPSSRFVAQYLEHPEQAVVVGGTSYENAPANPQGILRWKYGKCREERTLELRRKSPYAFFTVNNIRFQKACLLENPLDETLNQYGHEDSKLGETLKKKGIPIYHIANPLIHMGIDPAEIFLSKTQQGVKNLYQLYLKEGVGAETKLIKTYLLLKKTYTLGLFRLAYQLFQNLIKRQLLSAHPKLIYFDLFKLNTLAQAARGK